MKKGRLNILLQLLGFISIFFCWVSLAAAQQPFPFSTSGEGDTPIDVTADSLEYIKGEKKIAAKGNVVVVYQGQKLTADYAEVHTDTKQAYAEGHVTISQKGGLLRGEKVFYNFETHEGSFPQGTAIQHPWYGYADQIDQISKDEIKLTNALFTTCPLDLGDPNYDVVAKSATIIPGKRFIAYDIRFKILGKTVFWLPYLNIPLDTHWDPPFAIQAGQSDQWGVYVLTSKTFNLIDDVEVRLHADWYQKRGVGGGADLFYNFEALRSTGFVKLYGIQDDEAPVNSNVDPGGQDNPFSERKKRDRYRLTVKHRTDFSDLTNLILQFHDLSDEFFLQDFFEREFRGEIQPRSFGVLTLNTERTGLFLHVDVQSNRFFDTTEELPHIRFDWNNQQIGASPLFYRSQTGVAQFRKKFSLSEEEEESWRFDTLHRFSLPHRFGAFQVVPEIGVRETYYADSPDNGGSQNRFNVEAQIDVKTQAHRIFDWKGSFLGMKFNQVRHLVEPSVRYRNVESLGTDQKELFRFDPVDFQGDQREFVLGLENRIQTKREYKGEWKRVDVVSLNAFVFFNIKTDRVGIEDRTAFTNFKTEVTVRPYDWLILDWESDLSLISGKFITSNFDIILSYQDRVSLLIGHRYLGSDNLLDGSNQLVVDATLKLNPRWYVGGYVRMEFDTSEVEEWQIRFTRNLSCGWFLDLGFNVRQNDIRNNDTSLYARLTLVPLNASLESGARAQFANPRIGDRVAGGASRHFAQNSLGQWRYRDYASTY